jgi:hypothetical protein
MKASTFLPGVALEFDSIDVYGLAPVLFQERFYHLAQREPCAGSRDAFSQGDIKSWAASDWIGERVVDVA